jgi:enterochelin esterase family protein
MPEASASTLATLLLALASPAFAQAPGASSSTPATCRGQGFLPAPASYKSVEQLPDKRVTFRVCAPEATSVAVVSNDIADVIPMGIAGGPSGLPMTKDSSGLWTATTPVPVAADTYRFNFRVDGVIVPNPQSTTFSPAMVGTNSTFEVLGPEGAFQTYNKDIPHGAVSEVEY